MRGALDELGGNQSMNRLAADMAMMTTLTDPLRQKLSQAMDEPSRFAGTFESTLKNIQVVTGYTTDEMKALHGELLAIGGKAIAGPQAVAEAYNDVAGGITNTAVQLGVLDSSVRLAEAGQADLGVAANGMVKVMNAYGFANEDAESAAKKAAFAADVFTQTVGMGVGSMDEFVASMSPVAGLAASVGVGFDELGSAMAYSTSKGQTASVAATQIKAAMISLLNPNETLANALASVGIESGSAMLKEYGLAESLSIVKTALGGSQDAMAKALGSTEALQIAVALTGETYDGFATDFGTGMKGITEAAQSVQLESLEAKMAKLESASAALQTQIGGDINSIKGFFVDMQTGFLQNIASPILSSPVGPAISKIAAIAGMGAKGILDMGSGALAAAAQMTTLAANISNAGGIAKLFTSSMGLMGSGLKILGTPLRVAGSGILGMGKSVIGALPAMGGWIASMWASATATIAATWPILAIIAGVAALAAGVYLLVKNWSSVSDFFVGLWEKIKGAFFAAWDWIKNLIFGASDWILAAVAIFMPIIGVPALIIKHWDSIKTFFVNLWNNPKETIMGFIDWISGKVEAFTAPFKAIGDVVGGVFSKIGGFFGGLFGGAEESGSQLNDAFAGGIQRNASAPQAAFGNSLQGVARQMPHSDAPEGPLSELTSSGRALTDTFASGMDENTLQEKASLVFSAALPQGEAAIGFPSSESSAGNGTSGQTVHIQNLYLQADDCQNLLDFVRMIMHSVHRPEEVPV